MLNKRIIIVLLLVIIAMGTLSSLSANDSADDITGNAGYDEIGVDETIYDLSQNDDEKIELESDDDILESSDDGTFTALQNKINKASEGSTISLDNDYSYNANFENTNGVTISKSLTINGNGHVIDGMSKSSLLKVTDAEKVILNNLIFKNGCYNDDSNIVSIIDTDEFELNSCSFIDNYAPYGGAIEIVDVLESSIVDCSFDDNFAKYGGAILLDGVDDSSVIDCSFNGNIASYGGAIYLQDVESSSIVGCSFDENYGLEFGGAIYLQEVNSFSVTDCSFNDNWARIGGAISLNQFDNSSFIGCSFVNNSGNYGGAVILDEHAYSTFESCIFSNNSAEFAGGSIYSRSYESISVENCNFSSNLAKNASAGAIYLENGKQSHFNSCSFDNNLATRGGGGAFYLKNLNDYHIGLCNFTNNLASMGGCIFSEDSGAVLSDSNIVSSASQSQGGAIFSNYSDIAVNNCNFKDCFSEEDVGGAIYMIGSNLNVISSSFINGTATYGGAISSLESDLVVSSSRFINNSAEAFGGAIYSLYGNASVDDSLFVNSCADVGGAINCMMSDSLIFTDNVFLNSTAELNMDIYTVYSNNLVERGNHYENVYRIFVAYLCEVNGKRIIVRDSLNYVVSNTGTFLNSYDNLRDLAVYNDLVSLSLSDSDSGNSTIFGNYNANFTPVIHLDKHFNPGDEVKDEHLYVGVINYAGTIALHLEEKQIGQLPENEPFNFNFSGQIFSGDAQSVSNIAGDYDEPVSLIESICSDLKLIPSSYDSREFGYITPVGNQGRGGNCWAFAGLATLEACIKKATGLNTYYSEENAKNLMARHSIVGINLNTNQGGYDTMLMSYLANWLGPINELSEWYNSQSSLSQFYKPLLYVQNIKFLPARQNNLDNDLIKRAIMDYGAVSVTFDWTGSGLHAVSIVGWDDNYNNKDSLGNNAKGAWIFKNSWGTDWGDDGFGYLSYNVPFTSDLYDYCHAYTFIFNKNDAYVSNYHYDDVGVSDYLCSEGHIFCENKFTSAFEDSEYLAAFSTYFRTPTNYKVSVYVNGNLVLSQSGYSDAGYYTIPFNKKIYVPAGNEFTIRVENCNSGENYFPVSQSEELNSLNFNSDTSFVSFDGKTWFDLYNLKSRCEFLYGGFKSNTCQVACIKAFTCLDNLTSVNIAVNTFDNINLNEKVTLNIVFTGGDYVIDVIGGTLNISSLGGQRLKFIDGSLIPINISGKIYYAIINDDKASLTVSFDKAGIYTLTTQYKNNLFESNIVKFSFSVGQQANIDAKSVSKVYGGSEKLTVTLKDDNGNAIANTQVNVVFNGKSSTINTNSKGQATLAINALPKTYTATVSLLDDGKYYGSAKEVKITVKKATPKIIASKKTFKLKTKTKKYTITLKNNLGKVMKSTKVTIKVNGKAYSAKTNSKGKATFKLTKLKKRGSFKATITYAGSKYYNKVTKKVTITVKK